MTPPRIAVVTGASRGLGLETCRQLLEKGLQVILTAREIDHVERGLVALDRPGSIDGHPLNVADETSVNAFMNWLINKHKRIDALVNNAGRLYQHPERNEYEITPQEIVEAIDNNALGAWRMIRRVLPHMQQNGYGRIVNVSSGMGALSEMGSGAVSYRISKTVLNAITCIVTHELEGDVKINSICPGWVHTEMGGAGAPRDIPAGARGIVWAATLPADGPSGGFFRDGKPIEW